MVGASARKFWYGHQKIGENNFWFYFNHPPKCRCGCGMESDWDDVKLMWKDFKASHERTLSDKRKKHLRRNRRPKTNQFELFLPDDSDESGNHFD